jgi:ribonucleoside-diphosphate reductase alpha chain|tara:strand:- start:6 stop:1754 length:1749 start_codon:yes stop_codon:yes gene_type:complete
MRNITYEGPSTPLSQELDAMKYRQKGESFDGKVKRISRSLCDSVEHQWILEDIIGNMRFLPAGRVQSAMGADKLVTAYNCFVSGEIKDSMDSIMDRAKEAAETMRRGGGIGYDFSKVRPKGTQIKSLDSQASGPISFMSIFDAVCQTISSSGHRRGAQMGVLRVDHPDIVEFIMAKRNSDKLTGFNISVGITDKFMEALNKEDDSFNLIFDGIVYETVSAKKIWDQVMESTWDWAEPGVLFVDRIQEMNNLYYCEDISATNPCGEQPLPPYGACLLGSFNLTQYLSGESDNYTFNFEQFKDDIPHVVRAQDNVVDRTIYPLREQEDEAKNKRRMGLGVTGLANAGEMLGYEYGSKPFLRWMEKVFACLRDNTYFASAKLAEEKGAFPLYREEYLKGNFIRTLPAFVQKEIRKHGIRNSHLTSIAPTGTISLVADNISGGIEPVFSHSYQRTIQTFDGPRYEDVKDYAYARGVEGRKADDISVHEHLAVLTLAQHYVDSACSKTCNVGDDVEYEEFKEVYESAWREGCKGATTFRMSGKRYGIFNETPTQTTEAQESDSQEAQSEEGAEACFFDPQTGQRECS